MELQPIDDFVFKGFQQRFQQQFGCEALYVTTNEESIVAQRAKDGKPLEYPYAFLKIQSTGQSTDTYSSNYLSRRGLIAVVEDNELIAHRVRIIPATFDLEIKYVTNQFKSTAQGSVLAFIRRWLFARRNGALQFNVRYGLLSMGIQIQLSESVPFSPRENAPDNETAYQVVTSATIKGYISEPELGTVGLVQQVALQDVLNAEGLSGGQFFPFN